MNILGISCYYHDSAAAILVDGMLIAAAEEERFTRKKHDYSYPEQAINFCLKRAGITAADLDYVVFYEKPLLKFERILQTTLTTFPKSWAVFGEAMVAWFDEKLWIKSQLQTKVGVEPNQILFVEHHLSHAASSMFCSPFEEAAVLTIDGVGEWTTAAMGTATADWKGGGSDIKLNNELRFPHSLGLLYSAYTAYLGFRVNSGEYKVMGMAPYGEPKYMDEIYKTVKVDPDGGLTLDMSYFSFHYSPKHSFNSKFEELLGPKREPESEFFSLTTHPDKNHPDWSDSVAAQNQKYADIAASIQRVTEEIVLKMVGAAHRGSGGSKNLVMAGGVALNSVTNGRIVREGPFENVYIQPAAGDAGGAVGAALYAYHVVFGKPRKFVMDHAYWGADYTEGEMKQAITDSGFECAEFDDDDKLLDEAVDTLLQQKVIAWYRGRFEWGPRALGHRSIIADPRREEIKEIVNTKIKFREPFRPFAPVVMEERASEYFTTPNLDKQHPPRYMLMVSGIPEDKWDKIQAVCHNGTGRMQTVREEWNSGYYNLIKKFDEATGVPVLLNTSFNLRGEPIVNTPQEALNTFAASDIDQLVMGPFLVKKPEGYVATGSHLDEDQVD